MILFIKSKFTADKAFMDLSQPQAILGKSIDQEKKIMSKKNFKKNN